MKVSPIAEYLRINKAIPKRDKNGCHFVSPDGLYLGRLTKAIINNYRVINLETFGEGFKKMFTKSIAIGQQFAYIKDINAPLGISIVPIKTYARKIFVDFLNQTSKLEDTEKTLINKLDLITIDETTGVGLYDTNKPFIYHTAINKQELKKIKHPKFKHSYN